MSPADATPTSGRPMLEFIERQVGIPKRIRWLGHELGVRQVPWPLCLLMRMHRALA